MKRIATTHLLLGLGSVVIFGLNLCLRFRLEEGSKVPLLLSVLGVIVIGFGGWLGSEMVYVKGMAVEAVEVLQRRRKNEKLIYDSPNPFDAPASQWLIHLFAFREAEAADKATRQPHWAIL
jgi:hypothetical protein